MSDTPTATGLANQTTALAKQHYQYAVTNVRQYVGTRSSAFWIVLGILVVVFGGWFLYRWYVLRRWRRRYVDCPGCYLRFRDTIASVTDKRPIPARHLPRSRGGFTYTVWIYVAKWYGASSGKWKNLYYRGQEVNTEDQTCALSWDSVPRQNPGIWFSDDQNNLRVVVGTKVGLTKTASECLKSQTKDTALKFADQATEPADPKSKCDLRSEEQYVDMELLEHADIDDFPVGHWFHLTVVVTPQRMELYMNAKLVKTTVFTGRYEDDCTRRGFLTVGNPITGRIANLRYMPHPLPYQMIEYVYKTERAQAFRARTDPMKEWDNNYG